MHAMRTEDTPNVEKPADTKPDWRNEQVSAGDVHEMIAAMMKKKESGTRSTGGRDASRGRGRDKDKKGGSRGNSRDCAPRVRFIWDGTCFHCKSKDHKRDKCPGYAKLLEANGGKVPANYESAYNKAKKAWAESRKSKGAHTKAMLTEEFEQYEDTEGEDLSSDEDGDSAFGFAMVAKGIKPTVVSPAASRAPRLTSSFAPLMALDSSDEDAIPNGDMLDRLNGWAHKVSVKNRDCRSGAHRL